ncbi:MAG: TonB-dependent receptor domain-containing protein [Candidatus Cyclobacteriaceae bacterium M3_2C_046]
MLLILLPFNLAGQPTDPVHVQGKVADKETETALPYATVSIFLPRDSSLVTGGITDETGAFALTIKPGKYYAQVKFMGYAGKLLNDLEIKGNPDIFDLGIIYLEAETTSLQELVIEGEKDLVELGIDKKVYNVSQDPINAGRNASDILGNIPSVTVDGDGNVALRGSNNVQILIDGMPSGLLSFDGAEGLRQLQGNLVENVEVITNPSARYQAEGMAGIINIVLKKERSKGINGSFEFTVGHPDNIGTAVNLNYRRKALNFFINYGLTYRNIENPNNSLYQEVYDNDTTFITRQRNITRQKIFYNNIQLGADYFFDETNILTTAFTYRHAKGKRNTEIHYTDYINTEVSPDAIIRRFQDEDEIEPNLEYMLNYKKNFGSEDHELIAILTYIDNWEDSDQEYIQRNYLNDQIPDYLQQSINYETEKQLLLQADYVYPFSQEGKMEAGIRNTLRDITNDFLVTELIDGQWLSLPGLDNDFFYDENIYAAYLIFGNKIKNIGYQAGLRAEYTDLTTELLQTDEINHREYLNLFPSAHLNYELNKINTIQLSYSRRLHRPTYSDLTPFVTFYDNRNFFSGNPDLNPEYTHSFELGHIIQLADASISSALYYRYTDDKILRIRDVDQDGMATTQPFNLLQEDAYGAEFLSSWQPATWWKIDLNLNFFRSIIDGTNLDQSFEADTYTWFGRLNSRFTLWGNTDIQLRGNYDAPQMTPQGKQFYIAFLDLAINRDVFNSNGTLTLNVTDVFQSNRNRYYNEGDIFYTRGDFLRRPRQINLTLNYRLNQRNNGEK